MAYCTLADMVALFEELEIVEASNLRDSFESDPNATKIQAAIDGATGIIDGYLMRRYGLPIITPPEIAGALKIHCLNLARNLLDGSTEEVRGKANDAVAWLKLFSDPTKGGFGEDSTPGIQPGEGVGSVVSETPIYFWDADTIGALF